MPDGSAPAIGRRSNAETSPRSQSRSTISSPPQAPSKAPGGST
jgi:hypothetical protein